MLDVLVLGQQMQRGALASTDQDKFDERIKVLTRGKTALETEVADVYDWIKTQAPARTKTWIDEHLGD